MACSIVWHITLTRLYPQLDQPLAREPKTRRRDLCRDYSARAWRDWVAGRPGRDDSMVLSTVLTASKEEIIESTSDDDSWHIWYREPDIIRRGPAGGRSPAGMVEIRWQHTHVLATRAADLGAMDPIQESEARIAAQSAFEAMVAPCQPATIVSAYWHTSHRGTFGYCDLDMCLPTDEQVLCERGFVDGSSRRPHRHPQSF